MPPIDLYTNWNHRPSDSQIEIEPLRKYFFICEGRNTESFYFRKIINYKKTLGFHPSIELLLMQKTGEDENLSNPKQLLNFALKQRNDLIISGDFDENRDVLIIVFDLDVFKGKENELRDILAYKNDNLWFGLTNPDFELYLLLHIENSITEIIIPNQSIILDNKKIKMKRPCYKFLYDKTHLNSKNNSKIGDLALNLNIAIEQEKLINQNLNYCLTDITSNIAFLLSKIKNEKLPY